MSTYDDASLVMIPSGYKTGTVFSQKPMSTDGQLAFTRSNDTATRVASNGLIEKVRTNLVLQSNSFDTTWTASNASVTSGQAGYDGTNNAWLLSKSAASGYISQGPASSGSETISVYAKAGTDNWLYILVRDSASVFFGGYFDLQNGVVGSATGATTLKIESVGNGWYRCSASFVKSTSTYYRIYPAEGNNDTSGTSGNILIQASQLEAGDVATNYIPTTTTAVSVGPVANVPRLDYLNSSCPRLLLEPQRTNLVTYSEQFNNASWGKTGVTITANNTTAPDGTMSADLITATATTSEHGIGVSPTLLVNTPYSISIFVKAGTYNFINVGAGSSSATAWFKTTFDLSNGTFVAKAGANGTNLSSSIQNLGNGYFRISVTGQISVAGNFITFDLASSASPTFGSYGINSFTATGSENLFIWGAQLEQASYPSSYVNTLGAAVTRGADACSKTGISSLIGQTEGTLYLEFSTQPEGAGDTRISISDGTTNNWVFLGKEGPDYRAYVKGSGTVAYSNTSEDILNSGIVKMAIAYKNNDIAYYFNGTQRLSSASISFSGTLDRLIFGDNFAIGDVEESIKISQALLFKTRLPNSELASLTTL